MITLLYVSCAVDGFSAQLELDDLNYPLQKFDWSYQMEGAEIGKMQAPGRHNWRKDVRYLPIDLEGEILANTTTEFWDKRKALMQKVIPAFDNIEPNPVKFRLQVDGDSNFYYAFCVQETNVGALEATGAPTVQEFQLGFSCRFGYWRREIDDSPAII